MKFARRAFLQFTAGLTGGALLSPLPWKLADDSAIWSQNWSWRPSPERGEITKVATICRFCDGGCGIRARLVNKNRAILLEGNPNHPLNKGGICPLGAAGLQFLYAPYRIPQPLKQTKKRGDAAGFKPISWSDALTELTSKLNKLRSEEKANCLACITEKPRSSMDALWQRFFLAYGSPNLFRTPSHADSLTLASSLVAGEDSSLAFSIENASYVLSFGADLLEGWGGVCRMQAMFGAWREESRTKLVQVESRCSMTAAKADRWIAISPGSQAALALSICHALIKENRYDADFVANNVFGFEDWTDAAGKSRRGFKSLVLADYAPEQTAERIGLDAVKIRELAKEFGDRKNAIALWGGSQGDHPNNVYHDLAFVALNILKGNMRPAGPVSLAPQIPLGQLPTIALDEAAQKGMSQKRLDLAQPTASPFPGNGLHAFLNAVARGGAYPVEVLMVHEANPAYTLPDNALFQAALEKIGFVASFSSYMDETALLADLILPNHTVLERYEDVIGLPSAPYAYYAIASPILKPLLGAMSTGDALLQIAGKLEEGVSRSFPWKNYEAFLQERVNGLAASGRGAIADDTNTDLGTLQTGTQPKVNFSDGADLWKKLTAGKCWYDAPTHPEGALATPSGKLELALRILQENGVSSDDDLTYLPHFAQTQPSGDDREYPLRLVSYRMISLAEGKLANPPFLTKTLWDFLLKGDGMFVELHPQTAQTLSLKEGERAILKTPRGEVPVLVHISRGARPEVVYMVRGLGHKTYDEYIQNKGVNAYSLMEVRMDAVTGLAAIQPTRAQLKRL